MRSPLPTADQLDLTGWVLDQLGPSRAPRALLAGAGAAPLAVGLRRRLGHDPILLVTEGRSATTRPAVRAAPGRWPLREAVLDTAVVVAGTHLAAFGVELARVLAPDGRAWLVVRGARHLVELDELAHEASGARPAPPPEVTVEAAIEALAPGLVPEAVEHRQGVEPVGDLGEVLRAVQGLRPRLAPRLSGFTGWTTVMARATALATRAMADQGSWTVTVDLAVLRCRRRR